MRQVIIATHGDFSKGLKHSLEMIVGEAAAKIVTYSLYPGASASDFAQELLKTIQSNQEIEYVILADLYGASVVNSLVELSDQQNVRVISGVNLNLALELMLTSEERLSDAQLAQIILNAQEGIKEVKILAVENDEF